MQSLMSDCVYYDGELWLSLVTVKIDKQYLSSCAARLETCFSRAIINADGDWRITNTTVSDSATTVGWYFQWFTYFLCGPWRVFLRNLPISSLTKQGRGEAVVSAGTDSWCECLSHLFNLGRAKYQNPFSDSNQYWVCGSEVCLAVRESLFSGCGYSHKQFRLWSCSSLFVVGAMICNNISMFSPYKHSNVWIQKRFLLQALMRCGGCTQEIFASCRSWEHWPVSTKQKKERLKTV
jgi:hypothetical protein